MMDFSGLNPRQADAVRHGDGPLLILAGAGTGKTRTLACRIAHLVWRGVPADAILAVAFTNKSAEELRQRVRGMLDRGRKVPAVSTFHSFCVRVLRKEIVHLGLKPNFTIYDTADQLSVVREVARESRLAGRDLDARRLQWIISRARNEGRDLDAGDGSDEYEFLASQLYPRYIRALRSYNALDFDDLLLLTLELFEKNRDVLARWKKKCSHVLVDEFQDTNAVQYRLVSLLAAPEGNLTVVGDDDQSIYGWRGAAPANILSFTRDWPGAKVITLDQNYRSTGRILKASNAVISRNKGRRKKKLWSDLGEGEPVTLLTCADEEDEAAAIVEMIGTIVAGGHGRPGDCAVIFRTNAQSRPFEDALGRARLRYVVVGGMRFYDRREVRDLLAYFAAANNPRDEIALLRVLNYPPRGIGRETVIHLQEESLRLGVPLVDVMGRATSMPGIGGRQSQAISSFLELLENARRLFRPGRLAEGARYIVNETGLEEAVYNSIKDGEAGMRKVENLREAVAAVTSFQEADPGAGLSEYLSLVNLNGREEESGDEFSDQAVALLTVHSAKGLEFPYVFFAGLEEGVLPHRRSETEAGGTEEERRLAYVGMTRARRELVLSHAASRIRRGEKEVDTAPSRFLEDLPLDDIKRIDRRAPAKKDPEQEKHLAADFFTWINNLK